MDQKHKCESRNTKTARGIRRQCPTGHTYEKGLPAQDSNCGRFMENSLDTELHKLKKLLPRKKNQLNEETA